VRHRLQNQELYLLTVLEIKVMISHNVPKEVTDIETCFDTFKA